MRNYFAVLLFLMPYLLFSQGGKGLKILKLIERGDACKKSYLRFFASGEKEFLWEDLESKQWDYFNEEFLDFKKLLETQTAQPNIFSGCECVQYATTQGGNKENLRQKAVEIYEIKFKRTIQVERAMNKIVPANIATIDWPDASIPVRFHTKEKSMFIFLDASDDHDEKEAVVWFNALVSRLIQNLDDL